jgi:hypothetical protein
MIEEIWKILSKFNQDAHQAALAKCIELELDPSSGVVSLDESYINLIWSCNTLKEAIEKQKLIQLPITIQKELIESLETISSNHDDLLAGTDTVKVLTDGIEKLYTAIWRYSLNHLSDELLGYQTKLNQLKDIERSVIETKTKLEEGIAVKDALDLILNDANQQDETLKSLVTNANASVETTANVLAQVEESNQQATDSLAIIQQYEKTATEELASAQASNEQVGTYEKNIHALVAAFTSLTDELEANKKTQAELFAEFEAYRKKIDDLLGDANRTGMAASFTNRRIWLIAPLFGWLFIFGCSIAGLWYMGVTYIAPILNSASSATWEQLPLRLALTAPFVWLGWFSARQYGYTSRLREDYAYKEASAKSFEDYKREAKEVDQEMLQKLLEQAIKNLGDNPIRIYDGHENHGSPFHEFFEKILKDEKAMGQLKDLISKAKS